MNFTPTEKGLSNDLNVLSNNRTNKLSDDLSNEITQLLVSILMVYLNSIVSLFGIVGNAVNIRVIAKQGFRDSINVSLFVLAFSDIGALLAGLVFSVCENQTFVDADLPVEPYAVQNVAASFTRGAFSRINSSVTAFITLERCLCVVLPLRVKGLISEKVTAFVVGAIFISMALTLVPFYLVVGLGWRYDIQRNRTVLGIVSVAYSGPADVNVSIAIHTVVQIASYGLITISTIVLLVKLKLQSQWRQRLPGMSENSSSGVTRKLNRTLALVTTMAVIYLVCYAPSLAALMAHFAEEQFSVFGNLVNYFTLAMAFSMLLENINSSTTVLLYYLMSANYRKVFINIYCVRRNIKGNSRKF